MELLREFRLADAIARCPGRGVDADRQFVAVGETPDIAGKGIANPYAMVESTRMLLDWLGARRAIASATAAAALMLTGTEGALADPSTRTPDIRGTGSQRDMVEGILAHMSN